MGVVKEHTPVKLIVGMISSFPHLFEQTRKALEKEFGAGDYESPILPFDKTDHYREEFGPELKRRFYSFKKLIDAERLAEIKLFTNCLEKELVSEDGSFVCPSLEGRFVSGGKALAVRRRINIDPGYLAPGKLVLATTKDHQHRIYLGKDIYAEVTLRFKNGSFCPWEWTYPDYRIPEYIDIFNRIRSIYLKQLNQD